MLARIAFACCLRAGGEEVLLEHYAQLFPDALQLLEVLGVLALVLDLGVDSWMVMLAIVSAWILAVLVQELRRIA
jgi:hypothetical protein